MLDWDTLRVVLAVSREGTLLGAAQSLDVSIATVSRTVGRAEAALDAKLFDRRHKGLFATEQGQMAVRTAETIETEVLRLQDDVGGSSTSLEGKIRFSLPLSVLPYGLAGDLKAFRDRYPEVIVEIDARDDLVDFGERQADVVLRVGESPMNSLWGFRIATVGVSFYGSKAFLEKWHDEMESSPQTVPVPYVELSTANPEADREEIAARYPNVQVAASCTGMDGLIPLVRQGFGLGRIMRYMAANYEDLEKVFDCDEKWGRSVWILTHRDYHKNLRIRTFMEFLHERFVARGKQF